MENKQSTSKKKLLSIEEEKLIREVKYDSLVDKPPKLHKKPLLLDLEIFHNNAHRKGSQKVLVSIKPRTVPAIKTIYIAEKKKRKGSSKSGSRLAIGDHSSFTTQFSKNDCDIIHSVLCETDNSKELESQKVSSISTSEEDSKDSISKFSHENISRPNVYNDKPRSAEKCYIYTQFPINMKLPMLETKVDPSTKRSNKTDIATLIITNTSSEDSEPPIVNTISHLHKRINCLERKILRQEMVFRSLDPDIDLSSSDEDSRDELKSPSVTGRPGCSYIEQYSHVPETSAFQRYAHQAAPLSPSKATTIEKEHNSEQYGRDFTTYDGITARGRRQCASVPCKRDDVPKLAAAERVHKIRHKLNPVRDYRLMDTVHYLAQGEFAPRDDGIKLTPSREAVLSDIIYEDVCRTHWPNTRLGRSGRTAHTERCGTRGELQRLIDSLLRERVAHVERRRRRHYRIVKLNHRHESCRPMGKTGDIIVASHKNRPGSEDATNDLHPGSALLLDRHNHDQSRPRSHRKMDPMLSADLRHRRRSRAEECAAGPSRSPTSREPTCCYQASTKHMTSQNVSNSKQTREQNHNLTSTSSSGSTYKSHYRNPRLVVKKDCSRRKQPKDEPNLEHYILLPTLVVRTPSNVKRQKKFNELYHKILKCQINNGRDSSDTSKTVKFQSETKKNVGLNVDLSESNSTEDQSK